MQCLPKRFGIALVCLGHRDSLNGSFRKSASSHREITTSSKSSYFIPDSEMVFKALKGFRRKLVELDLFTESLEEWVLDADTVGKEEKSFRPPFLIEELRSLDYALEGVLFQQLFRMPCSPYASNERKEDEYLALGDLLYTIADGLWRTFWHKNVPLPYFVSCPRYPGSKFYTVEKAISRGRLGGLCGAALISKEAGSSQKVCWDEVVEFALFRPDIMMENEFRLSSSAICEAIFYGIHILLSRVSSKHSSVISDCVYILVIDSKFGSLVKLRGDLGKLELSLDNPYQSTVGWIKHYAEVSISPVDRIWNKLGNVNWGDVGTLGLLLATFHSIEQWSGPPRKSVASLLSDHILRIEKRRIESRFNDNENAIVPFQHNGELDHHIRPSPKKRPSRLKLKKGELLELEDQQEGGRKCFRIVEESLVVGGDCCCYGAVTLDSMTELLALYVGAHPSHLQPSWEDMSLWYQVQRQTKVLNILKEQGISSKYLPEIIASGRVVHSGPCEKESVKGRCHHPWCGTPILVMCPVGEPLSYLVARDGPFSPDEAIRLCRDCLSAFRSARMGNVQHGNISPENIIRVLDPRKSLGSSALYVPVSWGRAVLDDRDSPAISLQFSSAHALQHGKLCPSSDAESLVYLIYFVCGGTIQQQDSIESALGWRQRCWSKRLIQQHLGEVSAVLKAFADYVDSLCGTPYPVDHDIWIKRLNKAVECSSDRGKVVVEALRLRDVAETSRG